MKAEYEMGGPSSKLNMRYIEAREKEHVVIKGRGEGVLTFGRGSSRMDES